ncbi:MAG: HDOD domain-containing protein [Proteobacteria bacterium]|nr:HDOD domain-containing protein [Pseudomonadota bacterium]
MSIWTRAVSTLLRRAPAPVAAPAVVAQARLPVDAADDDAPTTLAIDPAAHQAAVEALQRPYIAWLCGLPQEPAAAIGNAARDALLARLDAATATDAQCNALLPRAPQVVPQLMKALRDEHYASTDVAERLSRDAELATEAIRLANQKQRADREPISDLAHAVTAIGASGLRSVISKSVLRPMFDVRGTSLSARASKQIWKDGDRKARLGSALAANDLLDPLDGYLSGLLHNTGWTALLRALDAIPDAAAILPGACLDAGFVDALVRRRDRLFGRLVRPWDVGPVMNALADELAGPGLATARSPLGRILHYADRLAMLHAVARSERLPEHDFGAHLAHLPAPVRDCYVTTLGRS